jgi:hypothetical protein
LCPAAACRLGVATKPTAAGQPRERHPEIRLRTLFTALAVDAELTRHVGVGLWQKLS